MAKPMKCPHQMLASKSNMILNGKLEVHVDYHPINYEGMCVRYLVMICTLNRTL